MAIEAPKIYDITLSDEEQGLVLGFSLDEGLEESETSALYARARIKDSSYFQPLFLNILPGGKRAEAIVEPGKVQDGYKVELQFYMERYPSREKSQFFQKGVNFTPDWFDLTAFEHEVRASFEVRGVEVQAQEACRFPIIQPEEKVAFPNAALDANIGLWVVVDGETIIGIAPEQPSFGYAWRKAWFAQVLERSREIRTENGWDDGEVH